MDEQRYPSLLPAPPEPPRSFYGLGRAGAAALLAIGLVTGGGICGFIMASAAPTQSPATLGAPGTYAITLSADTEAGADAESDARTGSGCHHDHAATEGALY